MISNSKFFFLDLNNFYHHCYRRKNPRKCDALEKKCRTAFEKEEKPVLNEELQALIMLIDSMQKDFEQRFWSTSLQISLKRTVNGELFSKLCENVIAFYASFIYCIYISFLSYVFLHYEIVVHIILHFK